MLRINFIRKGKQTDFSSEFTEKLLLISKVFPEKQILDDGFTNFSAIHYRLNMKWNCLF